MASEFVSFQRQLLKTTLGNDKRLETREIVSQKSLLFPPLKSSLSRRVVREPMATKPTKARRAAPRRRRKPPPSDKPKRHAWTRRDGEIHRPGYKIGYARVSTLDQNLGLQQDALKEAGCEKIFIEQMSGAVSDRPALREALDYARSGDTLIVWKLDRLARSMKQLIETIEKLRLRNIGFRSLTEAIDTTTAQGVLVFHIFSALAIRARPIRERTRAGLAGQARGANRRPTAEADRGRSRRCEDVVRQSRHYRWRCRRPSRGVARDAVSLPSRRANGEYRRRLKMSGASPIILTALGALPAPRLESSRRKTFPIGQIRLAGGKTCTPTSPTELPILLFPQQLPPGQNILQPLCEGVRSISLSSEMVLCTLVRVQPLYSSYCGLHRPNKFGL